MRIVFESNLAAPETATDARKDTDSMKNDITQARPFSTSRCTPDLMAKERSSCGTNRLDSCHAREEGTSNMISKEITPPQMSNTLQTSSR